MSIDAMKQAERVIRCTANEAERCPRCGKADPAEIHTCTPQEPVAGLLEQNTMLDKKLAEMERVNEQLLEALEWLDNWLCEKPMPECVARIRAAIAAATHHRPDRICRCPACIQFFTDNDMEGA